MHIHTEHIKIEILHYYCSDKAEELYTFFQVSKFKSDFGDKAKIVKVVWKWLNFEKKM